MHNHANIRINFRGFQAWCLQNVYSGTRQTVHRHKRAFYNNTVYNTTNNTGVDMSDSIAEVGGKPYLVFLPPGKTL